MTLTIILFGIIGVIVVVLLAKKRARLRQAGPTPPVGRPPDPPDRYWYPLLGEAQPRPLTRTPRYKIQYQSNGFDELRPKQISKTTVWLQDQGAGHLVGEFIAAANDVQHMPEWIDQAYEKIVGQYKDCGGKFAAFAASDDPTTIFIEAVPIPMYSAPTNQWAGGMALSDKRTARCVMIGVNGLLTNPATADLRLFKDYVRFEIGNLLSLRYGHKPVKLADSTGANDEWGDLPPCSQQLR